MPMPLSVSQQSQPVRRDDELHAAVAPRRALASSRTAYGAPDAPVIADDDRRPVIAHQRTYADAQRVERSAARNRRTTMLITPFIVKNAASSPTESSAFTSECS